MARSKPALESLLPQICEYVKHWSGGSKPIFLNALLQFARTVDKPYYDHVSKSMLDKISKIDLGVGLGGRYRIMVLKQLISMGPQAVNNHLLTPLAKKGTNQHQLAIKAEVEADVFEKAIQKITKNVMKGEVIHQIGRFDSDVVAFVHNMNKKFKSLREIQSYHFDHILVHLNVKTKNPSRDEPPKR